MEIALLNNTSMRIKGKSGSVIINPTAKAFDASGFIKFEDFDIDLSKIAENALIVKGPGEYEFGGIKVTGIRYTNDMIYIIRVDKVSVLFGRADVYTKEYSKLNEANIVLSYCPVLSDPSFVTSIAANVAIFYGEKADETIKLLAKEDYKSDSKYSISFEKLPQELEKILLK